MGLPYQFKKGLRQRINQYKEVLKQIGKCFQELEIWFVDVKDKKCEESKKMD